MIRLIRGDCLEVLATLEANSIAACVTDPPYGLRFMNRRWDYSVPTVEQWAAVLRVLKPGAHLLAFGGTRTYHRLVCAAEDAGFEIRDQLQWLYGEGFPKSRNPDGEWAGWGTALKPGFEPIVLARKPLEGTLAENLERYGTGAINVDGCRIPVEDPESYQRNCSGERGHEGTRSIDQRGATDMRMGGGEANSRGRWPANVLHDGSPEVLAHFPEAPGARGDVRGDEPSSKTSGIFNKFNARLGAEARGDEGSAARFFYCAKASREDREDGLAHLPKRPLFWSSGEQSPGTFQSAGTDKSARNNHPNVKPTDLMQWLCRLVTPPGGTVLDPFMGSGSTGRGAFLENFHFVGIEREAEWLPIAEARIRAIAPLFAQIEVT